AESDVEEQAAHAAVDRGGEKARDALVNRHGPSARREQARHASANRGVVVEDMYCSVWHHCPFSASQPLELALSDSGPTKRSPLRAARTAGTSSSAAADFTRYPSPPIARHFPARSRSHSMVANTIRASGLAWRISVAAAIPSRSGIAISVTRTSGRSVIAVS